MSQPATDSLDDLAHDAANVAAFLESLGAAVPGAVPDALLSYLRGLGTDPVGLAVLGAALAARQQQAAQGQQRPSVIRR